MKSFLLAFAVALISLTAISQSTGKIIYYEGKVEIGNGKDWLPVKLNSEVKKEQRIRTMGSGLAEILWSNGSKTIVGPNSNQSISDLLAASSSKVKTETEGVFTGFKAKVNTKAGAKRTEEGGIRRDEAESEEKGKETVYWKEDKEISFEEAYSIYESKDYGKAIAALQAFLNQKPKDEMARYAMFALGHSYIMSNNNIKAKEIFQNFIALYPNDPLKGDAEQVLLKL